MKTITAPKKKRKQPDVSRSYNKMKNFAGKTYSGMSVGRSHKWYYDKGEWKETKITPDLWSVSYAVTKRRAGKAPKGSGAATGTAYHWYILAHQHVEKLNEDDYTTSMNGLKFKLNYKRAGKAKWNATAPTQRKHLVAFLKKILAQLEKEVVPFEFVYKEQEYKGEAVPVLETFFNGIYNEFEITLNNEYAGVMRRMKNSWKLEMIKDVKLTNAIGEAVMKVYM